MNLNPQVTLRSPRLLKFFGFNFDGPQACASMPLSLWVKCLWWRVTGKKP